MKTHCDTGVTLSVKNLLGTISPQDRQAAHRTNIQRAIVDVYSYFNQKMDLLVSGSDPTAVDAACVKVMGGTARAIPHLALARQYGLGVLDFSVEGEIVDAVRRDFDMPPLLPDLRSRLASYAIAHVFQKRSYCRQMYRLRCLHF